MTQAEGDHLCAMVLLLLQQLAGMPPNGPARRLTDPGEPLHDWKRAQEHAA